MLFEIKKHHEKLKKISKLSDEELNTVYSKLLARITFINEELIPEKKWIVARNLVQDIDIDDVDFVALTIHLKGTLWTGDKALYNGLTQKKFMKICNTADLKKMRL